jgi:hypothetical protein
MPARPARVSASPPIFIARRAISARPRVMSAARALWPKPRPSLAPAAMAMTFLRRAAHLDADHVVGEVDAEAFWGALLVTGDAGAGDGAAGLDGEADDDVSGAPFAAAAADLAAVAGDGALDVLAGELGGGGGGLFVFFAADLAEDVVDAVGLGGVLGGLLGGVFGGIFGGLGGGVFGGFGGLVLLGERGGGVLVFGLGGVFVVFGGLVGGVLVRGRGVLGGGLGGCLGGCLGGLFGGLLFLGWRGGGCGRGRGHGWGGHDLDLGVVVLGGDEVGEGGDGDQEEEDGGGDGDLDALVGFFGAHGGDGVVEVDGDVWCGVGGEGVGDVGEVDEAAGVFGGVAEVRGDGAGVADEAGGACGAGEVDEAALVDLFALWGGLWRGCGLAEVLEAEEDRVVVTCFDGVILRVLVGHRLHQLHRPGRRWGLWTPGAVTVLSNSYAARQYKPPCARLHPPLER